MQQPDMQITVKTSDQKVRLRQQLMPLLPPDGTPVSITALARMTETAPWQVIQALIDDYLDGHLDFDVRADAFSMPKPAH